MNLQQTEKFVPDWKLHSICPTCKSKSIGGCRCMLSDQSCANGHTWFVCPVHHKTVLGLSDHSGDTYRCQCDSTSFYRTEA